MTPARIAELLAPFLDPEDQRPKTGDLLIHISTYINLLCRWNTHINLTAIRNEEEIVTRHFGEGLFAARHLFPHVAPSTSPARAGRSRSIGTAGVEQVNDRRPLLASPARSEGTDDALAVADLGSGAGFPGIPMKLWTPEIHLTLIESNHKKATFLREVTRALTLTNVNIQTTRAESLSGIFFDVVTLRAVEKFESILPVAAGLLAPKGRLALLISQTQLHQAHAFLPILSWSQPLPIPASKSRVLAIGTRRQ